MTSDRKVKEFLEIESLASKITDELSELEKESKKHIKASQGFSTALARIENLSESVAKGADELAALSKSMSESVLPEIFDKIEEIREQVSTTRKQIFIGVACVAIFQIISLILLLSR